MIALLEYIDVEINRRGSSSFDLSLKASLQKQWFSSQSFIYIMSTWVHSSFKRMTSSLMWPSTGKQRISWTNGSEKNDMPASERSRCSWFAHLIKIFYCSNCTIKTNARITGNKEVCRARHWIKWNAGEWNSTPFKRVKWRSNRV